MTLDQLLKDRPPKADRKTPRVEIDTATYDLLASRLGRVPVSQFVSALAFQAAHTLGDIDVERLIERCEKAGDRRRPPPAKRTLGEPDVVGPGGGEAQPGQPGADQPA